MSHDIFAPGKKFGAYTLLNGIPHPECHDVWYAYDDVNHKHVTIKVIYDDDSNDFKILSLLNKYDPDDEYFCGHMKDHFIVGESICIVFDFYQHTLQWKIENEQLNNITIRKICKEILICLKFLATNNIVHADLKPGNIMFTADGTIKVIDFGFSFDNISVKPTTYAGKELIQTLYYEAPEVILEAPCNCAVDMWTVGCILFEMYTGKTLFDNETIFCGSSEHDRIAKMMQMIGELPTKKFLAKAKKSDEFFYTNQYDDVRLYRNGPISIVSLADFVGDDEHCLDFVKRCLTWDPDDRMTPDEALKHPFMMT